MTGNPADNHGPRVGCKATICGLAKPDVCPFIVNFSDLLVTGPHQHEFRQLKFQGTMSLPEFYCIHCLLFRAMP